MKDTTVVGGVYQHYSRENQMLLSAVSAAVLDIFGGADER